MSFSKIYAMQISGLQADIITIEVDLSNGLHAFSIVGLGDRAVEEAKDRVSAAIKNSGFTSPKQKNQKVVISLAPANIRKEGTIFDLGMAIGYLLASGNIHFNSEKHVFIGELSLEGNLHGTAGVLAMIRTAKEMGFRSAFVPRENAKEAALVSDIEIYPANSLLQVIGHVLEQKIIQKQSRTKITVSMGDLDPKNNFGFISGNESAKRGLEISAAGRHNVALYGPPGTGKTMLAKALETILPNLSYKEVLEVTEIHSIFKTHLKYLKNDAGIITRPPFRAPHHTSPYSAIIGGGSNPKPGEITLAHRGIIFLDEFTEFDHRTIDSLRQPMEEKKITITRTKGSIVYPADCIYVLAMNPCPCGGKNCICTEKEILRYRKKISGPIADRIDIWIPVVKVDYDAHSAPALKNKNESKLMLERVKEARLFRYNRIKKENSGQNIISKRDVLLFFKKSAQKLDFSARAITRTANVARTIADIAQSKEIEKEHIMEALQYRQRM